MDVQNDGMADECTDVAISSATDASKANDLRADVPEGLPGAATLRWPRDAGRMEA
ncbi:MAG: hypothetical protein ACLQVM_00195 [Terriglobia bacterium]